MVPTTSVFNVKSYSKRALFWAGFVLTASFLFATFVFPEFFSKKSPATLNPQPSTLNPLLSDSDHDGLQNWEEELYKTDPTIADTDGDGTPDGEEIKLGRNPVVAGPDDKLVSAEIPEKPENQNLTQIIFEEFMRNGGMAAMLNQPGENNPEAVAQRVENFLKTGALPAKAIDKLEKVDGLQLSETKDAKAIKKYLDEVGALADEYGKKLPAEDDLDLFLEITESQNTERLKELTPYRELAQETAKKLREVNVPEDFAEIHGQMVWLMEESARQLAVLEKADADPAAALAVVPARIDLKIQAARFFEELNQEVGG